MKILRLLLALVLGMMILTGCSNNTKSKQYFGTEPFHYLEGTSDTTEYEIFLYKMDRVKRFIMNERKAQNNNSLKEYVGEWESKNGILELIFEDGARVAVQGYESTPHVIYSEIEDFYLTELRVGEDVIVYEGTSKNGEIEYKLNMRLLRKEASIPFIPRRDIDDTFVLSVEEKEGRKIVSKDRYVGGWTLKERILTIKLDDNMLYFMTEKDSIKLLNYDNVYGIENVLLKKIK